MKLELKDDKGFTPIVMTITIETRRELEMFVALGNAPEFDKLKFLNATKYDKSSPNFSNQEVRSFDLFYFKLSNKL